MPKIYVFLVHCNHHRRKAKKSADRFFLLLLILDQQQRSLLIYSQSVCRQDDILPISSDRPRQSNPIPSSAQSTTSTVLSLTVLLLFTLESSVSKRLQQSKCTRPGILEYVFISDQAALSRVKLVKKWKVIYHTSWRRRKKKLKEERKAVRGRRSQPHQQRRSRMWSFDFKSFAYFNGS